MLLKLASLDLKTNLFWNKECDVLSSVYDVTNKVQSLDSTDIMDVIMWLTFDNFYDWSYHDLNFIRIWLEKTIF